MKTCIYPVLLAAASFSAYGAGTDSIADHPIDLQDVNIVAIRHLPAGDPGSRYLFSIDARRIASVNPQSTADLLTADGRLTVQKSQFGGGSPSIRGFESSRVLLLVDGVRMNNLIYRAGHLQNVITIDPSAISKVDILYGPSSVVYGSDALGGAIAFYTKSPRLAAEDEGAIFNGSAFMRYGSVNNESTLHADFNIAGSRIASYTAISFSRFGDLKSGRMSNPFMTDGDHYIHREFDVVHDNAGQDVLVPNRRYWVELESGYHQYDLLQKFLIRQSDRISHSINFQFSNTGDVPRYDRLTDMKGDKPKFAQWYYGPQTRLLGIYTLNLDHALGADAASVAISYQNIKESRHNRKLNDMWLGNRRERVNIVSLNSDWVKSWGHHSLTAGIDGSLQFLRSTADRVDVNTGEVKTLDTRYPDGHNHMHDIEIFGVHRWDINSLWSMNEGLRLGYSSLRSTFVSKEFYPFLPQYVGTIKQDNFVYCANVGLTFSPVEKWAFNFDLSTGYRVPDIDDLAKVFDSQPGMVVMPNPDIKPEKTLGLNLTATFLNTDVLKWEAGLFGTYMFDAISLGRSSINGQDEIMYDGEMSEVYTSRNNRLAYVLGGQTSITARLSGHFRADAALNYAYGNILAHDEEPRQPLDHVAPLFGRVGVTYHIAGDRVTAEFYSLFNGKKPLSRYNLSGEDNIGYATVLGPEGDGLPAWFTLNLHLSWHPIAGVTIQGGIDNILDMQYRTFGSGINAPGRNLFVAIRTTF